MKARETLKEMKSKLGIGKSFSDDDILWLLNRIYKLTEALEILSKEQNISLYRNEMFEIARKALEGD